MSGSKAKKSMAVVGGVNASVFIGNSPIEFDVSQSILKGTAMPVVAFAAKKKAKLATAAEREPRPFSYIGKIESGSHIKTKSRWVLGRVPDADSEHPHGYRFFAARRRLSKKRHWSYWGYTFFHGKKHYGWVDFMNVHFGEKNRKPNKKPMKAYSAYQLETAAQIKAGYVYKSKAKAPVPLLAFLPCKHEVALYWNPDTGDPAHEKLPLVQGKDKHGKEVTGVRFYIRYTMKKPWVLIMGNDDAWYFMRRPADFEKKLVRLKPTRPLRPPTVLPKAM